MNLYLVRHGEAKSKDEDPARGLSDSGISDVKKVAAYLAGMNLKVNNIYHSVKLRAMQTAQIIADSIGIDQAITEADGLAPMDDPRIWFERIHELKDDTMLVGHLPYLSILSALLISGDRGNGLVEFEAGSVACIQRSEDGSWQLKWKAAPGDIR
jgi:phosphohistidine phosphatase